MSAVWSSKRAFWILAGLPVILLPLTLLPGCGPQSYPEELKYPPRTDPIIDTSPAATPQGLPIGPDSPGQWSDLMAEYYHAKGKAFDPMGKLNPEGKPLKDVPKAADWLKQLDDYLPGMRGELQDFLKETFGTPAEPTVEGLDAKTEAKLQVDSDTLKAGSRLYRQHCFHCHGLVGDGHGPTGPWVNPHPRDYRSGLFKFITSQGEKGRKPRREDLLRTLRMGIDGTSMPSFGQLPEEDLNKVVSYVIHLSLRGEVELLTLKEMVDENTQEKEFEELKTAKVQRFAKSQLLKLAQQWAYSDEHPLEVKYPYGDSEEEHFESIARGYERFNKNCIACHLDYGRKFNYKWDDWGTVVRPADLTAGVYRGGRRATDLYNRMFSGIPGTPMSAAGPTEHADGVWDIVNFVQALPYPNMLNKPAGYKGTYANLDMRGTIYPK